MGTEGRNNLVRLQCLNLFSYFKNGLMYHICFICNKIVFAFKIVLRNETVTSVFVDKIHFSGRK